MTKDDQIIDTIQQGQGARMIRNDVEDHLIGREEDIITELVALYRGDNLTNDKLRGSIGELAGIRRFRESLEAKIRRGVMAAEVQIGVEDNG